MRLIDADTTLDLLRSLGNRDYRRSKGTIAEAEKMLMHEEYTPTLDAEPVRHGHWIRHDELICCEDECSECHEYMHICSARYGCEGKKQYYNYCPNCGAKMDEVSEC